MSSVHVIEIDEAVDGWADLLSLLDGSPMAWVTCIHWRRTSDLAVGGLDDDAQALRHIRSAGRTVIVSLAGRVPGDGMRLAFAADVVLADADTVVTAAGASGLPWRGSSDRAAGARGLAWIALVTDATAKEAQHAGLVDRIVGANAAAEAEQLAHLFAQRGRSANAELKALFSSGLVAGAALDRAERDAHARLTDRDTPG